jgi:hypothetical protein
VGSRYIGGDGKITLITKDGKQFVKGKKMDKNMYRMFALINMTDSSSHIYSAMAQTFLGEELAIDWETWHQCFRHVGYSGLQNLLDNKMIDSFNIDTRTPKLDCITCTEVNSM